MDNPMIIVRLVHTASLLAQVLTVIMICCFLFLVCELLFWAVEHLDDGD